MSDMGASSTVEIPGVLSGERVDRVVALLSGCTRAQVARLVAARGVRLCGIVVATGSRRVHAGDLLETDLRLLVETECELVRAAAPGEVPFRVVYDDQAVIVVDKPPGVVVHPDAAHRSGTLVAGLLASYPELAQLPRLGCGESDRPGIVHRLDKGTSGLLVVAKTPEGFLGLSHQLAERVMERTYLGMVQGHVSEERGVVDAPIGRSTRTPTLMTVRSDGRPARTGYEVIARVDKPHALTLLRLRLETGRTHLIRVHLATIGHPVVNDLRYGHRRDRRLDEERFFLHSTTLAFHHPRSDEWISAHAPLPSDLRDLVPPEFEL